MDTTETTQNDITDFIGSRICHDLVGPLGALANGVEMLSATIPAAMKQAPELALIRDGVISANARLKFFRLAFGVSDAHSTVTGAEFQGLLPHFSANARVRYHWHGPVSAPRSDLKILGLLLMCVETAVPFGGDVRITFHDGAQTPWCVVVESDRLQWDAPLWDGLCAASPPPAAGLSAPEVQFALLPPALANANRRLNISAKAAEVSLSF